MTTLLEQIGNNVFLSTLYDLIKFGTSYLLARGLYDGFFIKWRWGGWETIVARGNDELARRKIAPARVKSILDDDTELSVYIKGVVSFHDWLKIDVCSDEAKKTGLLTIDRINRKITVDLAKNPPGEAKEKATSNLR